MPRRDDTFIIYYAEDFTEYETSNPSNLYCLSQSSIDIILSALRFATWPTRWRTDRQDYRGKVSVPEWEELKKWGELAIQEATYEMGCDINEGLTNIANALTASATAQANAIAKLSNSVTVLANAQCCELPMGGSGGVQGTVDTGDTGPIPIYGETPIDTGREPGTFPPEFEDEESYLLNKCAVANLIVDGVISTLHGFAAFTVFNATALVALIALATASIIIMPPVAIPVMVGCILALVGFTTYFEGMSNEIENQRHDYVCILYQGETIEVMISLLADFIDAVLAIVGGAGWITRILKQVFLLLNNPDTLKQLFDGVAGAGYPDADCSTCVSECFSFDEDLGTWVLDTQFGAGGGTIEWVDTPWDGSISFETTASGQSASAARTDVPDRVRVTYGVDLLGAMTTHQLIAVYSDNSFEALFSAGNWTEGPHPGIDVNSSAEKSLSKLVLYFASDSGAFQAGIADICVYDITGA